MAFVFLCHASEDKPLVEPIQLALLNAGHKVFFDKQSLPPGGDYQTRILEAINRCDVFIFIASSASISEGKYTLSELKFARMRWATPVNRVLPVIIGGVSPGDLDPYLKTVTAMSVSGNVAAEVRVEVDVMLKNLKWSERRRFMNWMAIGAAVVALLVTVYLNLSPKALLPPGLSEITNKTNIIPSVDKKTQVEPEDASINFTVLEMDSNPGKTPTNTVKSTSSVRSTLNKSLPESTNGWLVDVIVKVPEYDSNGYSWEKNSPPDLAIGIKAKKDEKSKFYPSQIVGWGVLATMDCRDSYSCKFSNVKVTDKKFELGVVNVNAVNSKIMAIGECELEKPCNLGNIKVEFDWNNYY